MQLFQDERNPTFYQERRRADVLSVLKRNVPEVCKSQKQIKIFHLGRLKQQNSSKETNYSSQKLYLASNLSQHYRTVILQLCNCIVLFITNVYGSILNHENPNLTQFQDYAIKRSSLIYLNTTTLSSTDCFIDCMAKFTLAILALN